MTSRNGVADSNSVIGGAMKKVVLLSLFFGVVSVAQATAIPTYQGFVYTGGTFTSIAVPGIDTQTTGINDTGQIVGSFLDRGRVGSAFLYTAGTFTTIPLPLPPGTF